MDWRLYGNITEEEYNQLYAFCVQQNNIGCGFHLDDLLSHISHERHKRTVRIWRDTPPITIAEQVREKIKRG